MTKPLPRRGRHARTLPAPPVAVLGDYPHFLEGMLRKALDRVGIRYGPTVANDTAVVVFWNPWDRLRWADVAPPRTGARTVNATHFDSAKSNVARHFEDVFGYPLSVDPIDYDGPIVAKSEVNAVHDGRILPGPIPASELEEGVVYQRLVRNEAGPSILELRIPVVVEVTADCYLKVRPSGDTERFMPANSAFWLTSTRFFLSVAEVEKINAFCASIGLEFGHLDVLRDRLSGRIYIVDANNTPFGPVAVMHPRDADEALRALGLEFGRRFGLAHSRRAAEPDPVPGLRGADRAAAMAGLRVLGSLRAVPPAYALARGVGRFTQAVGGLRPGTPR
jgi:hypothetical protein